MRHRASGRRPTRSPRSVSSTAPVPFSDCSRSAPQGGVTQQVQPPEQWKKAYREPLASTSQASLVERVSGASHAPSEAHAFGWLPSVRAQQVPLVRTVTSPSSAPRAIAQKAAGRSSRTPPKARGSWAHVVTDTASSGTALSGSASSGSVSSLPQPNRPTSDDTKRKRVIGMMCASVPCPAEEDQLPPHGARPALIQGRSTEAQQASRRPLRGGLRYGPRRPLVGAGQPEPTAGRRTE